MTKTLYADIGNQPKCRQQVITAPTSNAGRQQSFCKSGRSAGTIIFALQKSVNIVSLLKAFR